MTTPYLLNDLLRDEGERLTAYPDPLTHGAPWTIGVGHTGQDVHEGLTITEEQSRDLLAADVAKVVKGLDENLAWWRDLSDVRQDVLVNMGFNLGVAGLLQFHHFLAYAEKGSFAAAADDMMDSLWARQVKMRAGRLAKQFASGVHQP